MTWLLSIPWVRSAGLWIGGAVILIGAFLGFAAAQRARGREQERSAQREKALEHSETRDEIDRDVARAGDASERLRDGWSRD